MTGLKALAEEREWEVTVVPLVAGQRSVREKEWLEALGIFGIGKEDGQRIIARLGHTLLDEHEKLFGPDLPAPPGRLEWRDLERVGRLQRSRTSRPYIYCKIYGV